MPYPMPKNSNIYVELKCFQPKHEMSSLEVYTDFYGISFIMQGDRKLITPNMISILNAGDVGFTTKNIYHRATYLTLAPYSRYLIKFKSEVAEKILDRLHIKDINLLLKYPVYHFTPEMQDKIQNLFSNMLLEFEHYDKYSEVLLENMLSQLLLTVAREHIFNPTTDIIIHNANKKILDAICYIDSHFSENPHIEEISSYIGFSVSHFSRLFKQNTGVTFSTYLCLVKLQNSMVLLVHSNQSIEEIAIACGFSDASYLCHIFKKKYGISPSNYRKSNNAFIQIAQPDK